MALGGFSQEAERFRDIDEAWWCANTPYPHPRTCLGCAYKGRCHECGEPSQEVRCGKHAAKSGPVT